MSLRLFSGQKQMQLYACADTKLFKPAFKTILERFDICVEAAPVTFAELEDQTTENEDSAVIRSRVEKAVKIQATRFQGTDIRNNSRMGQKEIQRFCKLKEPEKRFARRVYEARGISARG